MHDLTHTGTLQIDKWKRSDIVDEKFTEEEIEEIIQSAEAIGCRAILGISYLSIDDTASGK